MKHGTPLDPSALTSHPLPAVVDGDKETKGRILIVAGSRDVPGAALLCATAAMRAGAGKLCIVTVKSAAHHLGMRMPEAMVVGLPEDDDGGFGPSAVDAIKKQAESADAIVGGPGMSNGEVCGRISQALLETRASLALDAALLHSLEPLTPHERASPPVLLPHAGELSSLLDCEEEEIERDPIRCGIRAAELYRSVVLVKGVTSHVVTPAGEAWTYEGGAPGLGVSGSGDVLGASSEACSRAAPNRSMPCSGRCGCTARPARTLRKPSVRSAFSPVRSPTRFPHYCPAELLPLE